MKYNKLIRDKIPDLRRAEGQQVKTHVASGSEYWDRLRHKLREETAEYLKDEKDEELADVLEVLYAICAYKQLSFEKVEAIRQAKLEEKGGFEGRIILDEIVE